VTGVGTRSGGGNDFKYRMEEAGGLG